MYGPSLAPGDESAKALGVDAAVPDAEFTAAVASLATERRTIYTPFAAEVLGQPVAGRPHAVLGCQQGRSVGRPGLPRSGVRRQTEGRRAAVGDQGPRSDRERAARDQEPARDRRHPRGHADRRSRHRRGDARRAARHARVRVAGRRRVRLQEVRRARAGVLRADRDGPQHLLHALQPQHGDPAGRRSGAVRLRARLQVLPVGRHARLSRPTARSRLVSARCTRST